MMIVRVVLFCSFWMCTANTYELSMLRVEELGTYSKSETIDTSTFFLSYGFGGSISDF